MSDESPRESIQRIGGLGIEYLGMPTIWDHKDWLRDPDLYSVMWTYKEAIGEHPRTYAALYAELWVLQVMGLIEIVCIEPPGYGDFALWVDFKYTDAGSLAVWKAMWDNNDIS